MECINFTFGNDFVIMKITNVKPEESIRKVKNFSPHFSFLCSLEMMVYKNLNEAFSILIKRLKKQQKRAYLSIEYARHSNQVEILPTICLRKDV